MLIILRNTFDVIPGEPHIGIPGGPTGVDVRRLVFELRREADAEAQGSLILELVRIGTSFRGGRTTFEIRRSEVVHTRGNRGTFEIDRRGLVRGGSRRLVLDLRRITLASPRGRLISRI